MNYEQRISALEKAVFQAQPLPTLTDEHSPEVVRPRWEAIPQEEKDAGWWRLEVMGKTRGSPSQVLPTVRGYEFYDHCSYFIVKTEKHPDNDRHARVKLEWDKVKDAGTHEIWAKDGSDSSLTWFNTGGRPCWVEHLDYEIRPIAKKKIDLSRLPIGAMTNWGRLMDHKRDSCRCWLPDYETTDTSYEELRIVPMTQWEVLQDGDVIPDGIQFEIVWNSTIDDKAVRIYKIIGLKDGWTDE